MRAETFGAFREFETLLDKFERFCEVNRLDPKRFIVVGSGVLAVNAIRDVTDLDLIAMPDQWRNLVHRVKLKPKRNYMGGESQCIQLLPQVHCFDKVDTPNCFPVRGSRFVRAAEHLWHNCEEMDGMRYMRIEDHYEMKLGMERKKDIEDIRLLHKKEDLWK